MKFSNCGFLDLSRNKVLCIHTAREEKLKRRKEKFSKCRFLDLTRIEWQLNDTLPDLE